MHYVLIEKAIPSFALYVKNHFRFYFFIGNAWSAKHKVCNIPQPNGKILLAFEHSVKQPTSLMLASKKVPDESRGNGSKGVACVFISYSYIQNAV